MCGILISKSNNKDLINSIAHRGLESKTIETEQGFFLTHHRLPIQTEAGDPWSQPYDMGGGKYLLFNGEIFNYPKDRFGSDTEYLVDFFRQFKDYETLLIAGLPHIQTWDGFWSIVIYDKTKGEVIIFTDPLGKKQLYVNEEGEISSEIKPLINKESILDPTFFGAVHKWGYNHDDRTPFLNIKRIQPNLIYRWRIDSPQIKESFGPYFDFYAYTPTSDPVKDIRHLMWTSVENRLISKNYPISILLSGGLDSSIIGGILVELGAEIDWYTIENDEEEYVKACEDKWGIRVTRLKYNMDLADEAVIEDLKEIYCKWNETPIDLGSVVPQYNLFKAVKETSGHRIVISGDGADELFGGYRRIDNYDSQGSDVLHELTYYHLPRLDRTSMAQTIELRNPFLGHQVVQLAMTLPFEYRFHKKILKDGFLDLVPDKIIKRSKVPLKNDHIKKDPETYREFIIQLYKDFWKEYLLDNIK